MSKLGAAGLLTLVLIVLGSAASAQAAVTASTITSPANDSAFLDDTSAATSTVVFTVTGTTTGSGNVDIDCYDGNPGSPSRLTLVSDQPAPDNSFKVPITDAELDSAGLQDGTGADTCELRAVYTGDSANYPPGTSGAFAGRTISITSTGVISSGKYTVDFNDFFSGLGGELDFAGADDGGLQAGLLFAPGSLSWSNGSFADMGELLAPDANEDSSFPNGEIEVDGVYAADSSGADPALSGYEETSLSDSFSASANTLTVHDDEPLLTCVPSLSHCNSYASSGVELDRTWRTEDDGEVATQTDVFRSVDDKAHTLTVDEDDEICDEPNCESSGSALSSFEFPGSSSFKDYAAKADVTLPSSGPGTILFKTDSNTPAAGDGVNPQGAITYAGPPSGPVLFTYSDENGSGHSPEFVLPYSRSIPAGGSTTLRFAYVQGYALANVEAQAEDTIASYSPSLEITSPANGSTVREASATVTGTATDPAGIKSLTVNGAAVTVPSDGNWSTTVKLVHGSNTITAVATDEDGLTARTQATITNAAEPPVLTSLEAGRISSGRARLSGRINAEGLATTYQFRYSANRSYKSQTKIVTAGSGTTASEVSATITGLKAHTSYHYELTATNALGASTTAGSFETKKPSPVSLGTNVSPRTAHAFPYVYIAKGRLELPRGIGTKAGCSGKITLTVRRGRRRALIARAKIGERCTWSTKLELTKHRAVPGTGKLTITPGFPGNRALGRLTAKPITVRYG